MHRSMAISATGVLALAASASAGIVTYNFTGTVTLVTQPPPFGVSAQVGNPVTGTFMYDTLSPDIAGDPFFGDYPQGIVSGFSFIINGTPVYTSDYHVFVTNDNPPSYAFDELEVFATQGVIVDGVPQVGADMYVQLRDDFGTVFPNDSLPGPNLTLADFPDNDGLNLPNGYLLDITSNQRIEFSIDSLVGIPAPGALALGAVAMLFASRRRRV